MVPDTADITVLHAKYLDWYSAKVAELLLRSSPDDIYALAHREVEGEASPGPSSEPGGPAKAYRAWIARAVDELAAEAELPDFDVWLSAYREDPERYEREICGFWRSGISPAGVRDTGATTPQ